MLRLALLTTLVACSLAAEFSTTASFTVKVGKTKKVKTILLLLIFYILIIIFYHHDQNHHVHYLYNIFQTASCDITISYDGAVVSQADSSASCSVAW